jgi:hypothetical protein
MADLPEAKGNTSLFYNQTYPAEQVFFIPEKTVGDIQWQASSGTVLRLK